MTVRRATILLLCAGFPLLAWALLPLPSDGASPSAKLDRLQRQIQAKQGQIGAKKGTERVLTTQISSSTARIDALQRRQSAVEADLGASQSRLEATQVDLRAERARLVRLRARLKIVRAGLATRLRELYTAEQPDVVTVVLEAKGFAELLERGEFLRRVSDQDQRIFTAVRDAKAEATASEARLATLQKRQLAAHAAHPGATRRGGPGQGRRRPRPRGEAVRARLGARPAPQPRGRGRLAARPVGEDRRPAAQRAGRAGAARGPVRSGSGGLIWPVNGPITSPFCESRAWESCHPGIDIGVPAGTPIRAAAAGRVVLMQPESASGGYGNFTCVQHTASMSTCYAHQSRFATSMGASVRQGQVIGYSGCTGRCFGDHLHFEVRINGSVVNPMGYL